MGVRRGGGKMGISPPENWDYKNQKFRENRKSVAKFRLIDVILLICRYDTHTVRCSGVMQWWACSSVMSALCLQRQVAKLSSGLLYCWSLLRNKKRQKIVGLYCVTKNGKNSKGLLQVTVAGALRHVTAQQWRICAPWPRAPRFRGLHATLSYNHSIL